MAEPTAADIMAQMTPERRATFDWLEANAKRYGFEGSFARGTGGIDIDYLLRKLAAHLASALVAGDLRASLDPASEAAYFASIWGLSNPRMKKLEDAFRKFSKGAGVNSTERLNDVRATERAQAAEAQVQRLAQELGEIGTIYRDDQHATRKAYDDLAGQVQRLTASLADAVDALSAPIKWSEIQDALGRPGDPVDFSGIDVQIAACDILRDRAAAIRARKEKA